ncbi:hypothetical protein [Sphingosinicella sp. BN140058]|uniref:hypothetical protein n=1 Tax=Sphingosinicella sp. BN140058 TaxID=1892855 RepID=UPI001011CCBD|nr:hypothetical protein [Sphingosinicella sp. BN140058]QAY79311.1 hypothetical protein ETR14_24300 [Sphingosinicella sp. BN140058]
MTALDLPSPDSIKRRAMFALDLVDPITGRFAGADMAVTLAGFRPPRIASNGRLVWNDVDPPAPRDLVVRGVSRSGAFAPFETAWTTPERAPGDDGAGLIHRITLEPTGLYEPPAGALAAAGMLIGDGVGRAPVAGAEIRIELREAGSAAVIAGSYQGRTDLRGGFVVVAGDIGLATPAAASPGPEGGLVGWLRIARGADVRFSPLLPLRRDRLHRLPAPLVWADLGEDPP